MNPVAVAVGLIVGLACGVAVSLPGRPSTWHLVLAVLTAAVIAALITGALT